MRNRIPVRKIRIGPPRRGLVIDDAYLAWIRKMPCVVCGSVFRIEAAHVGRRGLGQKCSDREALPLCEKHHRTGLEAAHVLGRKFFEYWNLDRYSLIAEYNRVFENEFGSATDDTAVIGPERGEGVKRMEEALPLPHFESLNNVNNNARGR